MNLDDFPFDDCIRYIEQNKLFIARSKIENDRAFSQYSMTYAAVIQYLYSLEDNIEEGAEAAKRYIESIVLNDDSLHNITHDCFKKSEIANKVTDVVMVIRKMDSSILPIKSTKIND